MTGAHQLLLEFDEDEDEEPFDDEEAGGDADPDFDAADLGRALALVFGPGLTLDADCEAGDALRMLGTGIP